MEKVNGMTIEEWIKKSTAPREISLWGEVYDKEFEPPVVSKIQGDGKQLIYFGTIDQRPRWWLLRIDSGINIEDDFDTETFFYEPIEDEFGRQDEWVYEEDFPKSEFSEYYDSYQDYLDENNFPKMEYNTSGCHWGVVVNMVTGEHE